MEAGPLVAPGPTASPLRAWLYLVWLSWQRQARLRQMVWIALGLLALAVGIVAVNTALGRWTMHHWKFLGRSGPTVQEWMERSEAAGSLAPGPARAVNSAVNGAVSAFVRESDLVVFTRGFLFIIFVTFLLPIWSLAFATDALGGEREGQTLIWLFTRPLSRPAIYLAKFVAVLPWALALNMGGFYVLCLCAGRPGPEAFRLYWPAVLFASLAFCALFYLLGAFFRRPAIVAIAYAFFLEVVLQLMPGTLKRISIGFYARCMMYEAAESRGLEPANYTLFAPVSGGTALTVLVLVTVCLVGLGMMLFRRTQYDVGD